MNRLIIITVFCFAFAFADVVILQPRNDTSDSFLSDRQDFLAVASYGTTLVARGMTDVEGLNASWIVYREKDGRFSQIASVPIGVSPKTVRNPVNNGKWMGGFYGSYPGILMLFQLDENFNVVNLTRMEIYAASARLLSDSTIVYFYGERFNSLLFNEGNNTWIDGPGFDAPQAENSDFPFTTTWTDDDHIMFVTDQNAVFIFSRQSDGSWNQTDTFQATTMGRPCYNGVDTVFLAESQSVLLYTKINGSWTEQMMELPSDHYLFGSSPFKFVSPNTIIIGAFGDFGICTVIQRQNDTWSIVAEVTSPNGIIGASIFTINDNFMFSVMETVPEYQYAYNYTFVSMPFCAVRPINVTCSNNEKISSCDIDTWINSSYVIHDPCDDYIVKVSASNATVDGLQVSSTIEFERGAYRTSCIATGVCPPSSNPVASVNPSTSVNPPTIVPSQKISSASRIIGIVCSIAPILVLLV